MRGLTNHLPIPIPAAVRPATVTVFQAHPSATDEHNPLGTWAKPRKTLPNPIQAGSVVDILGPYDTAQTSPRVLVVQGEPGAPVVIRGGHPIAQAVISQSWQVNASHLTLDGLLFKAALVLLAPCDTVTVQGCEHVGSPTVSAGIQIASYDGQWNRNIVLARNYIHDNGDVNATFDQDFHGIAIGPYASSVWVLENHMARNSGDGIQINAGAGGHALLHHVYVAYNESHHNKQTGFWAKQCSDVVFGWNRAYGHRVSNSSNGAQMGCQYDPEHLWFIGNELFDGKTYGIRVTSDTDDGVDGEYVFAIDNIIHDIRTDDPAYDPTNYWHAAAISIGAGKLVYVFGNQLDNVEAGIVNGRSGTRVAYRDNVITQLGKGPAMTGYSLVSASAATVPAIRNYYASRYGVEAP